MRTPVADPPARSGMADVPLSEADLIALQQACAPVGLLTFPAVSTLRTLRQCGYVQIVLGGIQITPEGLERLLRERKRKQDRSRSHPC